MRLIHLIYHSKNNLQADDRGQLSNLREILAKAQSKNSQNGVTGYLIFDKSYFIQILEGDSETVMSTFERIKGDRRHMDIAVVETREIAMRSFGSWTMGAAMRSLDHEEVYLRHGISGPIDPRKLTGPRILALAADLRDLERERRRPAA